MASIDKRTTKAGVRYEVRYRGPDRRERSRSFARKVDAQRFAAEVETDKSRGEWIDPRAGQVTYAEWWERWWPTTVHLRPSSRARDESYARNHLLPRFGPLPLAAIDHAAVAAWVADLTASGLAPATVVKARQILAKTLDAAVDAALIRSNPTARVKPPKVEPHEMRFLTPAEVAALADAIDPRYRAFVLTAAYCGLRFGEMVALRRDRLDLLHRRLTVLETATEVRGRHHVGPPKTSAGRRTVPIPRNVADALAAHLDATPGDLVFPAPEGGYLRASLFRRRFWTPATKAAGVDPLRIHDLRHTAVALWIAAQATPKEIAARAGHSSVSVVLDRYGHLLPGQEDKVNDALDAMFEAARPAPNAEVRAILAPSAGSPE